MKLKIKAAAPPFLETLQKVYALSQHTEKISMGQIFRLLSRRGYAALLILFTLPFCLPIQIPGISTLFGLIIAFIGLRVFFGKELWWPQWILNKEIESDHLQKWMLKTINIVKSMQKILHPRWIKLTQTPLAHRMHGLVIFGLALLLSLPLPIPLTNLLCAFPLLFIGLGLLEDDGICILIGYLLALLCFGAFTAIFFFGISTLKTFVSPV